MRDLMASHRPPRGRRPAMTPRQRIHVALQRGQPDRVPFTIYWCMLPRGARERQLREAGLAIVERLSLFWAEYPHCDFLQQEYRENGIRTIREIIRTPVGELTSIRKVGLAYGSEARFEWFVKRKEDYRAVQFWVADAIYHPDYEALQIAADRLGEDGYVLPHIGYSPLMYMLIELMGMERFSFDMVEHPDEFFSLYELLCRRHRELYALYAASPAEAILYCGNVVPQVIGAKRFSNYIVPCLNECADYLHETGKMLGTHLDADTALLAPAVAASRIDFVEAFTPLPDCDMSVSQARRAWPDKVLWCNFPSSVHLSDDETIAETARMMIQEGGDRAGFLIGVTEDIPETHLWRSLSIIASAISKPTQK